MIGMNKRSVFRGFWLAGLLALLTGCGLTGARGSLAAGAKYQAAGNFRAAYIQAKQVLQKNDKDGAAWLLLGRATLMLGNPADALNDFENARTYGVPESDWAIPMGRTLLVTGKYDALLKALAPEKMPTATGRAGVDALRGDAYLALKQTDEAEQSYQAALTASPKNPEALLGLAKVAGTRNDLDGAVKYLEQTLAVAPDYPQAWILRGDMAFNVTNFSGAEDSYTKALNSKNHDLLPQQQFYARARLADAQTHQDKFDQALDNIRTLEVMSPGQPYPHYLEAAVYYKQGHFNEAISQLQQVLKAIPNNEPAQLLMGAVNYAQGNFGQAEMFLSNVMGLDSGNKPARRLLALTLYREGRTRQALTTLRPAVPGEPSDSELLAMLERGAAHGPGSPGSVAATSTTASPAEAQLASAGRALAAGDEADALHLLDTLPPGDTSVESQRYAMKVLAYVKEGHPKEAVRTASEFAQKAPQSSAAHLLYGTALVAAGERADARREYQQALKLDPVNFAALLSLASLDLLEGHEKDATARYQQILEKDPKNVLAITGLGRIATAQGDRARAIKWYQQATQVAPQYVPPYIALVAAYDNGGQAAQAEATAKKLLEIAPRNAAALNAMGVVQLNASKYKDALAPLSRAVALAPQEAAYRVNLARAQVLNKQFKDAQVNLNEVIKADPGEIQAVALLAFLKLQDGDMPAALGLAQSLQAHAATASQGASLEGDLYLAKHSYAKAAQAYQRSLKLDYTRSTVIKTFLALADSRAAHADEVLVGWLAKHPDDDAARMLVAQYYMDGADLARSAEQYRLVLKAYPSNIDALNNLAWVYTESKNAEAVPIAERAYKLAPSAAPIQDTYGWALTLNGQAKTALPLLLKAAKQSPSPGAIQYHLAVAQARTGNNAAAKETLAVLLKSGATFPGKADAEKLYRSLAGSAAKGGDR